MIVLPSKKVNIIIIVVLWSLAKTEVRSQKSEVRKQNIECRKILNSDPSTVLSTGHLTVGAGF